MTLEQMAKKLDDLYAEWLFDSEEETSGLDAFSEQEFLLALNALQEAARHMKLADLHQARAIASVQLGRRY